MTCPTCHSALGRREIAISICSSPWHDQAVQPPATPQEPGTGCIGCGKHRLVAYTIEHTPGPFCLECWTALKEHVGRASAPPAVWQDIETACETALRLDLPTRELVARIRSLRPSPPTPGGK